MARRRRRRLQRLVALGAVAAGMWAWRQRQLESNRRRFDLP